MPLIIFELRCHSCSQWYPRHSMLQFGDVNRCLKCDENHRKALEAFAGNPPDECAQCHVTWEQLCERTRGARVGMFIHEKDGCYQVLCQPCSDAYVPKRRDLYGATQFGHERGLS